MIKEKAFYSYPFQERCILQRKFKNEKKTQRIPISGWRIHWNQASLDPHTSLPSRGGPRKSQRVQRCSRSFNAYRSGASPSFSFSLISSSFFYPLCSSRVSSLLPLWCAFLGGTIDVSIPWGKWAPRVVQSGLRRRVCVVQKWCGVVDWRGKFLLRSVKSMRFDPRDLT